LTCWYAGESEGAHDVQIYCSNWDSTSGIWKPARVAVAEGERAELTLLPYKTMGNPVLYLDADQTLWLFYIVRTFGGWSTSYVDYKTSTDFGITWSDPRRFKSMIGNLTRIKPIELAPNQFMLPLYHELFSKNGYSCILDVSKGEIIESNCYEIPGIDHLQPAFVQHGEKILAYLRNSGSQSLLVSEFSLKSSEWSEPENTNLPNHDSSIDVVKSNGGNILMVYDDSTTARTPLSLAWSVDGKSFKKIWDFENDPNGEYS
jgi:alpha-L-fucosidase